MNRNFRLGFDWVNITCYGDITIVTVGDDYIGSICEHLYTNYMDAEKCYNQAVESIKNA